MDFSIIYQRNPQKAGLRVKLCVNSTERIWHRTKKRRNYSPEFKTKVLLSDIKNEMALSELAARIADNRPFGTKVERNETVAADKCCRQSSLYLRAERVTAEDQRLKRDLIFSTAIDSINILTTKHRMRFTSTFLILCRGPPKYSDILPAQSLNSKLWLSN